MVPSLSPRLAKQSCNPALLITPALTNPSYLLGRLGRSAEAFVEAGVVTVGDAFVVVAIGYFYFYENRALHDA
jgi:hypothetical protein